MNKYGVCVEWGSLCLRGCQSSSPPPPGEMVVVVAVQISCLGSLDARAAHVFRMPTACTPFDVPGLWPQAAPCLSPAPLHASLVICQELQLKDQLAIVSGQMATLQEEMASVRQRNGLLQRELDNMLHNAQGTPAANAPAGETHAEVCFMSSLRGDRPAPSRLSALLV